MVDDLLDLLDDDLELFELADLDEVVLALFFIVNVLSLSSYKMAFGSLELFVYLMEIL